MAPTERNGQIQTKTLSQERQSKQGQNSALLECSFPRKKFDEKNILSGNQSNIAPIQAKGFSLSALIRPKNYSYHLVFLPKEYSNIVLIRLMNYTNIELILLNSYSLFMLIRANAFSNFLLIRSKMHSLSRVGN